jgi:hypothetical protein
MKLFMDTAIIYFTLTLRAGFASGWNTESALMALTSTPIGCASCGIACIISCSNKKIQNVQIIYISENNKSTTNCHHIY